jgi:hypothetical protein
MKYGYGMYTVWIRYVYGPDGLIGPRSEGEDCC